MIDCAQGFLGRHDPASGQTREWPAPSKPSAPYAMAIVADGRICFFETAPQPNLLQCFDSKRERFAAPVPVPSGARAVRHIEFDPGRNGLWFGTDANTLGQVLLGDAATERRRWRALGTPPAGTSTRATA